MYAVRLLDKPIWAKLWTKIVDGKAHDASVPMLWVWVEAAARHLRRSSFLCAVDCFGIDGCKE